jgi:hypothetical protein
MTRKLFVAAATAAVLLLSPVASADAAEEFTGMTLLNYCENDDKAIKAICTSYLLGAVNGWKISQAINDEQDCIPKMVGAQKRAVYIRWANNNPEELHRGAAASAILAHIEAYPCDTTSELRR